MAAMRAERVESLRLDGRLVHEGGVEVPDLASVRAGRRPAAGGLLDDGAVPLLDGLEDAQESARAGAIGGDQGRAKVAPVGERVEVVAGRGGAVHRAGVDAA
jgi:hypothetical protein